MSSNESKENIWVVDDDRSIRWVLEKALSKANMEVRTFEEADSVIRALERGQPDAIISDVRMPGMDGLAMLDKIHANYPDLPIIIITAHSDLDSAVSAYQGGAFEYLPKPFDVDEAVELTRRAAKHHKEISQEKEIVSEPLQETEIIGEAASMKEVFRAIGRLSRSNITVLLNGESGTGKELVAEALHRHTPRADNAFIALNMAAIPRDLMESELFGHEKGAFTGAQSQRKGRFEQADGGSLFLDEIGDMPAELQTRLLRVLSDGEFYRVGGHSPVKVDVRIIAATHQNLEQRVEKGDFREDLFHRLNVIRIHIPALRERSEDIRILAKHFLQSAAAELDMETKTLDNESLKYLEKLEWRGNVRQLQNTCRWLTVMAPGQEVHLDDLPPELLNKETKIQVSGDWIKVLQHWAEQQLANGEKDLFDKATPEFERVMIQTALRSAGGRRQDAAKLLGCGRNTLTRKIKELDMDDTV